MKAVTVNIFITTILLLFFKPLEGQNNFEALKTNALNKEKAPDSNITPFINFLDHCIELDSNRLGLEFAERFYALGKKIKNDRLLGKCLVIKSGVYLNIGQYQKAYQMALECLKLGEKKKNIDLIVDGYWHMGNAQFMLGDWKSCLGYFRKIETILNKKKDFDIYIKADILSNIGTTYMSLIHESIEDLDTAEAYFKKALDVYEKNSTKQTSVADVYTNLAGVLKYRGDLNATNKTQLYQKAIEYTIKAISIYDRQNQHKKMGMALTNLGVYYYDIGQNDNAMNAFKKGNVYSRRANDYRSLQTQYDFIRYLYEQKKQFEEAYQFREYWVAVNDTVNIFEQKKHAEELELKYQTEKKERENELLRKREQIRTLELDNQRKQNATQRLYIFGALGGVALFIAIAFLLFRGNAQKKKANIALNKLNHEIELQRDQLSEKNVEIVSSITYAKRIQNAILPPKSYLNSILPHSFILYKPKDIVAGDFYWIKEVGEYLMVAICDCTGHGVPGAMVSVVGYNALNRAVNEYQLHSPALILDKVNIIVQETFARSEDEVKDGMDISLCVFNKSTGSCEFAGANSPLWLMRNREITEFLPDKQPIGFSYTQFNFTNKKIDLQKGDILYLRTDGYADQFGGEHGKKLKSSNLKKLLSTVSTQSFNDQNKELNRFFEEWRGNNEQIDDVTLMGVQFN